MDYDPTLDQDEVEMRQARDILEIELTKVQLNFGSHIEVIWVKDITVNFYSVQKIQICHFQA